MRIVRACSFRRCIGTAESVPFRFVVDGALVAPQGQIYSHCRFPFGSLRTVARSGQALDYAEQFGSELSCSAGNNNFEGHAAKDLDPSPAGKDAELRGDAISNVTGSLKKRLAWGRLCRKERPIRVGRFASSLRTSSRMGSLVPVDVTKRKVPPLRRSSLCDDLLRSGCQS